MMILYSLEPLWSLATGISNVVEPPVGCGYSMLYACAKSGASTLIWNPFGCSGFILLTWMPTATWYFVPDTTVSGIFHVYVTSQLPPSQQCFSLAVSAVGSIVNSGE